MLCYKHCVKLNILPGPLTKTIFIVNYICNYTCIRFDQYKTMEVDKLIISIVNYFVNYDY